MSCLTAFLLATAVWSAYSQINIKPKGIGRKTEQKLKDDKIFASVLVTKNEIWAGLTVGDRRQIRKEGEAYPWQDLGKVLKEFKDLSAFKNRADIEIAADDEVVYQNIIFTMDMAVSSGFDDIGLVDPASLSVRFTE